MPVHQLPNGKWKWGNHGTEYATKADAEKQAKAAYANGYREPSPLTRAMSSTKKSG